jgi:CRAL/TRIO domain
MDACSTLWVACFRANSTYLTLTLSDTNITSHQLTIVTALCCSLDRFECFCVLDLKGLTMSALSSKALAITKEQAAIDSVCFPETMSKMIIVNAPTFFAATWRIIKGWLDPRTASKIEVISNVKTMEKRLLELIDVDQLPVDYGGKGEHTEVTLANHHMGYRLGTEMMYLR